MWIRVHGVELGFHLKVAWTSALESPRSPHAAWTWRLIVGPERANLSDLLGKLDAQQSDRELSRWFVYTVIKSNKVNTRNFQPPSDGPTPIIDRHR